MTANIKVGVIGCGGRAYLLKSLFERKDVILKSVFDPAEIRMTEFAEGMGHPTAHHCKDYSEITKDPEISWVLVFSPNSFHKEHIIAAFESGKNVFSEKPLATKIEDCQAIFDAHQKSGKLFATGFVLRYAPLYMKVKEILDSGVVGQILSIDANENISSHHGSYIMANWRRHSKLAGSHLLEKCCHDLDLLNWFTASIPSKTASFGGRDLFLPENKHLENELKDSQGRSAYSPAQWRNFGMADSAFDSDKDIIDNQVTIFQYRNNIRVTFQCTLANAIPERRMYFSCSKGTLIAELYSGTIKMRRLGDDAIKLYDISGDGHGGGDPKIMDSLYDSMKNGTAPKCSGNEGIHSTVAALAADLSMTSGQIVDLEPIWKKLNR